MTSSLLSTGLRRQLIQQLAAKQKRTTSAISQGFTLIELLVVVIIIGILAAFAGLWIASAAGITSFWLTFLIQIFIAVVLVAITAYLFRKSDTG